MHRQDKLLGKAIQLLREARKIQAQRKFVKPGRWYNESDYSDDLRIWPTRAIQRAARLLSFHYRTDKVETTALKYISRQLPRGTDGGSIVDRTYKLWRWLHRLYVTKAMVLEVFDKAIEAIQEDRQGEEVSQSKVDKS